MVGKGRRADRLLAAPYQVVPLAVGGPRSNHYWSCRSLSRTAQIAYFAVKRLLELSLFKNKWSKKAHCPNPLNHSGLWSVRNNVNRVITEVICQLLCSRLKIRWTPYRVCYSRLGRPAHNVMSIRGPHTKSCPLHAHTYTILRACAHTRILSSKHTRHTISHDTH